MPITTTRYDNVHGVPLGVTIDGVSSALLPDPQGNIVGRIDASQTVVGKTWYWPYGERRTGNPGVNLGFGGAWGYYTDAPTSRIYVRARVLKPNYTRWLTVDPLWPQQDAFLFARSSPSSVFDPTGTRPPHFIGPRPIRPPWRPIAPPHRLPWIPEEGIGPGMTYGAYCGSANVRNPGWNVEPQDALDACCQIHDRCLEAHYGSGLNEADAHACCDADLSACASWAHLVGCGYSPHPDECEAAAWKITAGMYWAAQYFGCPKNCIESTFWPDLVHGHWRNPWTPVPY